jgi:hypothetical protein
LSVFNSTKLNIIYCRLSEDRKVRKKVGREERKKEEGKKEERDEKELRLSKKGRKNETKREREVWNEGRGKGRKRSEGYQRIRGRISNGRGTAINDKKLSRIDMADKK